MYTGLDGSPDAAICARIESDRCVGSEGAGWLHRLRDDHQWRERPLRHRIEFAEAPDPALMFDAIADQFTKAMSANHMNMLAGKLGVSPESLKRLRVGYSVQHRAYSFPMVDHYRQVRGIRLRDSVGGKWSVKGGREGLFIPRGLGPDEPFAGGGNPLICEGPTDCAALIDLGFSAIGRPNCSGGVQLIVDLVCDWHPDSIVVLADSDAPGQRGARYLAARLVGYVPGGVRIATPPKKDVREWVRNGATRDDVAELIDDAPTMQLMYGVKGGVA